MKKYSAMIVDDSPTDRYLLRRYLGKTEIISEIFEANDGHTALEMLTSFKENKEKYPDGFPPTLLFLDINMPKIGGFEFLEKYQALEKKLEELSLVVMMFTSSASEEDKNEAFSYPWVKDYLVKGAFKAQDIRDKIADHVKV